MSALIFAAETGALPVVIFERVDDPEHVVSCYLVGLEGAVRYWSPSPTTNQLASTLHRLAQRAPGMLSVDQLRDDEDAMRRRANIRKALDRVVAQIEEVSPEMGRALAGLEVMTDEGRVVARIKRPLRYRLDAR